MFNLRLLEFNAGLVIYWHNGFYHFLDSRNNLIKLESNRSETTSFEVVAPELSSRYIHFNKVVGRAKFYKNVFLSNLNHSDSLVKVDLVDKDAKVVGSLTIVCPAGQEEAEVSHNMNEFLDTVYVTLCNQSSQQKQA